MLSFGLKGKLQIRGGQKERQKEGNGNVVFGVRVGYVTLGDRVTNPSGPCFHSASLKKDLLSVGIL